MSLLREIVVGVVSVVIGTLAVNYLLDNNATLRRNFRGV